MINQDYLEDMFHEYFDDVDPKDEDTVTRCEEDFIDEAKGLAEKEAREFLDAKKMGCDDDMSFDAPEDC